MAKESVRIAAVGFLIQSAFQAVLALRAPLGSALGAESTMGNSLWVLQRVS